MEHQSNKTIISNITVTYYVTNTSCYEYNKDASNCHNKKDEDISDYDKEVIAFRKEMGAILMIIGTIIMVLIIVVPILTFLGIINC